MKNETKNKIIQAIKIWIAIYTSITLVNVLFGEWLNTFPMFVKTFFLTLFLVPWMVFVLLPIINAITNKLFGKTN